MNSTECSCRGEFQVAAEAEALIQETMTRLRPHFRRQKAHQHAADYLRGLIAEVERKNGWQLAEHAGYCHPRGMQRVLERYSWDQRAVREDLRQYVVGELGDPAGVLVVDETGCVKQGKHSAGVARQYCGTLGKIANCQVGVFLGYASPKGPTGIDGALFVPEGRFREPARCQKAGIPPGMAHCTKPQLALEMLESALDAGVPGRWVVGDESYGSDGKLRGALEVRGQGYVLAVRSNEKPSTWPPLACQGRKQWLNWEPPFLEKDGNATVVVKECKGLASMTGLTFPSVRP
jgi:SRSO17 transposase